MHAGKMPLKKLPVMRRHNTARKGPWGLQRCCLRGSLREQEAEQLLETLQENPKASLRKELNEEPSHQPACFA